MREQKGVFLEGEKIESPKQSFPLLLPSLFPPTKKTRTSWPPLRPGAVVPHDPCEQFILEEAQRERKRGLVKKERFFSLFLFFVRKKRAAARGAQEKKKKRKLLPLCVPAAAKACASCLHLATSAGLKSSCVDFFTAYSLPSSLCAALTTREKAPAPSGPSSRNSAA